MQVLNNSVYFEGSEYFMQSKSLKEICGNFETPFYIYDASYILDQYKKLKESFKWDKTEIFYAMKANYNPHILGIMRDNGFNIDTVSPAEVLLALKLGFDKSKILFTANNMTDYEMEIVKQTGVLFNIDSLPRLEAYGRRYPGTEVSLRINPDVIAGETDKVQTAGDLSKFGILIDDVPKAIAIAREYNIKIIGLHEHTGSGISETDKVFQSMQNIMKIANHIDFPDLEFVDFGGGFKVKYKPDEPEIDYVAFGKRTDELFEAFCNRYGRRLKMYFEPGKYTIADSACMVVQVNTVKNNKGRLIVGTNSGFPHLIRPVLYDAYHHVVNISNPQGTPIKYDIYGNTCESGDLFAGDREIQEIRVGDYLAIMNAGGYCRSMASEYNLRPLPSEYIIYDGDIITSKKKLTHLELAERIMKDYGINE